MMKKILIFFLSCMILAGCQKTEQNIAENTPDPTSGKNGCDIFEKCNDDTATEIVESTDFKEMYESLNGTENKKGKVHRTITIPENNPYIITTKEVVAEKLDNKETFWLYIGDPKCPWCRSVIEVATEKALEHNVDEIYTLNIWDSEGNEVLRDKYEIQDGELVKVSNGTMEYLRMLSIFDEFLEEYTLENDDGEEINVGEKRIFAPTFIRIVDGEATALETGISELQTESRQELTEEILNAQKNIFENFFKNE